MIYWDGNDWNIPECTSNHHDHRDQEELEVKATKRLAAICDAAHEARPDLMIVGVQPAVRQPSAVRARRAARSPTPTHFPTVQSELIQRQQMYQMTFEHPYRAIWGVGTG